MSTRTPTPVQSPLQYLADDVLAPGPERRARARARYDDFGQWLQDNVAEELAWDVRVYPQGSYPLGTTNVHPDTNEFDVDLVVSVDVTKHDITKQDLVDLLASWVRRYVNDRKNNGPAELAPVKSKKGKRAFKLVYGDDFHIDILPVVPQEVTAIMKGEPSWLTDRTLREWQHTNPQGFIDYWRALSDGEHRMLAKAADIDVEELPEHVPPTTLQQAVRLLKQHRDHAFTDDADGLAPPSVIITALAAHAYDAAQRRHGHPPRLSEIVAGMPEGIETDANGDIVVCNPSWPLENYADRYAGEPSKVRALQNWLSEVAAEFSAIEDSHGPDRFERVAKSFGEDLGRRTAEGLGGTVRNAATNGSLGVAATDALLDMTSSRPAPRKKFYGSPTNDNA